MIDVNRKLILSNLKYFSWWRNFVADVLTPFSFKISYKGTAILKKWFDQDPSARDSYRIKFSNMLHRMTFTSLKDEPNYVQLNIDSMAESDFLELVVKRCVAFWVYGISYIAWLYKLYPTFNVPFASLELKFIDNWLQSTFILDEVVRFFNYSPFEVKENMRFELAQHYVRIQIVAVLFANKYIFETLKFWWSNQDIKALTVNFPFDITVLSTDAQLYFYLYHYMDSLSIDTTAILAHNMFDYPPFDEAEKQILITFEKNQYGYYTPKLEDEIHAVYKAYIPFKVLEKEIESFKNK